MTKTGRTAIVGCLALVLVTVALAFQPHYVSAEQPAATRMVKPKADMDLKTVEAQLEDRLADLHNKLEKMKPESDDAEEVKKHAHQLMEKLEAVRREMHQRNQRHELEMELKKRIHELDQMREHHPDSREIHELEVQIEHLEQELRPKPRKKDVRPKVDQILKIFRIEHAPADHILEVVESFAGEGSVLSADPRTNILIVRAHPRFVEEIHEIIEHIDAPASPVWRHLAEQEMERELQMLEMHMRVKYHQHELERRSFGEERDGEEEEHPTIHITIHPVEEGLAFFLQDERISLEQLHERLSAIDVPEEWRLFLHVQGEVPEEMIHHMAESAEVLGFRKIQVEHRKTRVEREHEVEEHDMERHMEHDEGHESRHEDEGHESRHDDRDHESEPEPEAAH